MKFKSTILLLIVLILLAGIYYFVKESNKETDTDPEELKKVIFDENKDGIVKMSISDGENNVVFERKDKEWILVGKPEYVLDQSQIDVLALEFAELKAEKVIKEEATDEELKDFGLDERAKHVSFTTKDGKTHAGYLGDNTPMNDGYYFRRADSTTIYKIYSYPGSLMQPDANKFRSTRPFTLSTYEVEEFTVKQYKETFSFKRDGDNWQVIEGPEMTIDPEKVRDYLNNIVWGEIVTFKEDHPESYNNYGLTTPFLIITLKGKDKVETLEYGIGAGKDRVYAKRPDRPCVFIVRLNIEKLFASLEEYFAIDQSAEKSDSAS